jgi:hypothetical protein
MHQAVDRAPFEQLIRKLCEVFGKSCSDTLVDAYWTALKHHRLPALEREVQRCITSSRHMPKPVDLRPESEPPVQTTLVPDAAPKLDNFERFGNRCLLKFLLTQGAASEVSLQAMVSEKDRLVTDFRDMHNEDPVTAQEMRDALMSRFAKLYQPISQAEHTAAQECFADYGHSAPWPDMPSRPTKRRPA